MLSRVYIDNYKCFVNFEYKPTRKQLILGDNRSGKSTFFEVLSKLRKFIGEGMQIGEVFKEETLTRWQNRDLQTFEFDVDGNGGLYKYSLQVEHNRIEHKVRVCEEKSH